VGTRRRAGGLSGRSTATPTVPVRERDERLLRSSGRPSPVGALITPSAERESMLVLESSRLAGRDRLIQTVAAVALLLFAVAAAFLGRGPLPLGLALVVGLFALAALYVQLVRRPTGVDRTGGD
jgi:hypothetical protein